MRDLVVSIGGKHNARVKKTWRGSFEQFCAILLAKVPETMDKASAGWVCGAEFDPAYRDSENFVARHLLSFDYDHISPADVEPILSAYRRFAHLAYTTWSHTADHPRIRVWLPLSRPCGYDEFQAVSRKLAAAADIERMARESHVPAQYMYRPAIKPFEEFTSWVSTDSAWVDVDAVLGEYDDWTDRKLWPHRADGDGVHSEGDSPDPRTKPGIVGAFCRAFTITDAIEKFELPYKPGSAEGRWTYTDGSRPDGAIIYDDNTKLHSHHDTDPARGQSNAYDLVRLHRYGKDDGDAASLPIAQRPSSKRMAEFAGNLPAIRSAAVSDEGFEDLDATDFSWLDEQQPVSGAVVGGVGAEGAPHAAESAGKAALPKRIAEPSDDLTDQGNARRVQKWYGQRILSVGGLFYIWKDTHWAKDDQDSGSTEIVTKLSKRIKTEALELRDTMLAESPNNDLTQIQIEQFNAILRHGKASAGTGRIDACLKLLRRLLSFNATNLNPSKDLFNCANGTINLRTGILKKHDPLDFITACAPTAYNVNAEAPRFEKFLHEIFEGDLALIAFLKRWYGYCITGHVNEHKLVCHLGAGRNGKGTTMRLFRAVLGSDYYGSATKALLTLDQRGATPELVRLLGQRMVTISETPEDMKMDNDVVKWLTGGDTLAGRHLFKETIEFNPTHKLQIFTNSIPSIRGGDVAMWQRIILLNYPVRYGDAQTVANDKTGKWRLRDNFLDEALAAEAPGVLRWLIEGAQDWYQMGLEPPQSVLAATQEQEDEQDSTKAFARERLLEAPGARIPLAGQVGALMPAYQGWCKSMNIHPLGRKRLLKDLTRVLPNARSTEWREGSTLVVGVEGIALTDSDSFE